MIILYVLAGMMLGVAGMLCWEYGRKTPELPEPRLMDKENVGITAGDIIHLLSMNVTQDITSLIIEYELHLKEPEFYARYQAMAKHEKELYINELIDIFSKNKREYVRDLFDRYASFTHQDVLLLLMCEMQFSNKSMASILGLSLDTLKKRKTRLRVKMRTGKPVGA